MKKVLCWGAALGALWLADGRAEAAGKPKKRPVAAEKSDAAPVTAAELADADADKAFSAFRRLDRSPKALELLLAALADGVAPRAAEGAAEALGRFDDVRATDALVALAARPTPAVRRAALTALARQKVGKAEEAIRIGLGDVDASVRAAACKAVVARGDRGAEARLLKLLERGDEAAAEAVGKLATPRTVATLAESAGRLPDAIIASALSEVVRREDVADPLRVEVLRVIAKLPGAASTAALMDYLAQPGGKGRPSKDVAQKLIDERGGR